MVAFMGRSSWIDHDAMGHILAALMPDNRRVVRLCLATGLRISDALAIKTARLKSRMTVRDSKTGKAHRISIPAPLLRELQEHAGRVYVFEGRLDPQRPRTRQAVYKDIRRVAAMYKRSGVIPRAAVVSPHTARKIAAVDAYHAGGVDAARKVLNHSADDAAITLLYALADQMDAGGVTHGTGKRGRVR